MYVYFNRKRSLTQVIGIPEKSIAYEVCVMFDYHICNLHLVLTRKLYIHYLIYNLHVFYLYTMYSIHSMASVPIIHYPSDPSVNEREKIAKYI